MLILYQNKNNNGIKRLLIKQYNLARNNFVQHTLYEVIRDNAAENIDLKPIMSGLKAEDEGLYVVQHQYWIDVMKKAIAREESK